MALPKTPLALPRSRRTLTLLPLLPLFTLFFLPHLSPNVAAHAADPASPTFGTPLTLVPIAKEEIAAVRAVFAAFPPWSSSFFENIPSDRYRDPTTYTIYGPDGSIAVCCSYNCTWFFPLQCTQQGRITAIFTGDQLGNSVFAPYYKPSSPYPPFGSLSPAVGDLSELLSLSLGEFGLAGELPPSVSRLQKLTDLVLTGNNFSGPVPPGVFSLPALRVLDLSRNNLTGELPGAAEGEAAGALYSGSLIDLSLHGNRVSGLVPSAVAQMTALTRLDLGENALSGGIPKELHESLTRLEVARLDSNQLVGPFCHAVLPATEMYLGFNNFSHELNAFHGCQLPARVMLLSAPYAGLRGTVPADQFIQVNESGRFPWGFSPRSYDTISDLDRLIFFDILRSLDGLHLNLSHNSLSGNLKAFAVPDFHVLDLTHNSFTGSIPESFYTSIYTTSSGGYIQHRMMDLRFNQLSGPVTKWWQNPRYGREGWWQNGGCDWDRLRVSNNSAHLATAVPSGCLPPHSPEIAASAAETAALVAVRDALLGMREGEAVETRMEPQVKSGGATWWEAVLESWDPQRSSACGWYGVGCTADGHVDTLHILGDQWVNVHDNFVPDSPGCGFWILSDNWECAKPVPDLPVPFRLHLDALSRRNGSLSAALGQLTHLTSLRISNHTLSGSLPHSLSLLSNLVFLDLSDNRHLSGPITTSLYAFPSLQELNLRGNRLTGSFLGDDTSSSRSGDSLLSGCLESVDVGGNALSGSIPGSIGGLTSLCRLVVDHCGLEGTLPRQLGALWMLRELQLQGNALQGDLSSLAARYDPLPAAAAADPGAPAVWGLGGVFPLLSRPDLSSNQLSGDLRILFPFPPPLRCFNASFNRFTGTIPRVPLTGDLNSKAAFVDLSHNQLSGTLGEVMSPLLKLGVLRLSHNQIEGSIPGSARVVFEVDLSHNLLSGAIPAALSADYINVYDVSYNQLSSFSGGTTSSGFRLDVSHNELQGGFAPASMYFMHLNASWNNFTSFSLAALKASGATPRSLDLSNNRMSGSLLPLSACSTCNHVDLSYNRLSGTILPQLATATSYLTHLDLRGNLLSGTLPLWLTQAPALLHLDLSRNQLNGSLPEFCGNQQQLHTLLLSNNSFSGSLAPLLSSCASSLLSLDVSNNQLSGSLPPLSTCSTCNHVDLSYNRLSGTILPQLATATSYLTHLDLRGNLLSGTLPLWLTQAPALLHLDLSRNKLQGPLPAFCGNGQKLDTLLLSTNSFSGSLGPLLSSSSCASSLLSLDVSKNQLSSSLPRSISLFTALRSLIATRNRISSSIPAALASLKSLQAVDLSWNGLSGSIPSLLGAANETMDVRLADNSLSGSVPQGLSDLSQSAFRPGNPKLCGRPLPVCKPSKPGKGKCKFFC